MAGYDPKDSTSSKQDVGNILKSVRTAGSLKGLRIGVPKDYLVDGISPEVLSAVEKSYQLLEQQGATLVPIHLPHTKYSVAVYYIIAVSEASSNLSRFDGIRFGKRPADIDTAKDLAEFYKKVRAQFGPEVKRRIMLGTFALSSGYYDAYFTKACKVRRLIAQDFSEAFKTCDVIAAPVSPSTAYKVGEKAANPLKMYLNDIFTIPVNLAGLPGISLPCGQDSQGLPIGLHMIAPQFKDSLLLQTAAQFETLAKGVLT
jgi:aspartyl-tRNA(Asn)/glutamyl-tRNA(Gln) amidotransferase subunit A